MKTNLPLLPRAAILKTQVGPAYALRVGPAYAPQFHPSLPPVRDPVARTSGFCPRHLLESLGESGHGCESPEPTSPVVLGPMENAWIAGRVLVIEDDSDTRANLRDILEMDHHAVETAGSMGEALTLSSLAEIEVIVLDRRLPDGNSLDFLPSLRERAPDSAVMIVTAHTDLEGAIEALRQGAFDYILKPINADTLRIRTERLIERRRLALAKVRSDSIFRNLVEAAECMIVMLRPRDQAILYFSPFAEQLTGYKASEVQGKSFLELLVPEADRPQLIASQRAALDGSPQRGIECQIRCRDGRLRVMLRNVRCLPDYDGSPALLIVDHDITDRKAGAGARPAGGAAGRHRPDGRGACPREPQRLAAQPGLPRDARAELVDRPDALDLIDRVQKAQDHLHRLYEDVRELRGPDQARAPELRPRGRSGGEAWSHLEPLPARQAGRPARAIRRLELDLPGRPVPARAGVPQHPGQRPGGVSTTASRSRSRGLLPVSMAGRRSASPSATTGPGMTPEQHDKIFDPFFTTKTKGTGLGMAIAKRIVEAHGGRIAVGETGPPGAEIILTLPRQKDASS